MRIKNKKLMFLILTTTMGCGLLILTYGQVNPVAIGSEYHTTDDMEVSINSKRQDISSGIIEMDDNLTPILSEQDMSSTIPTKDPTPTPTPIPTPIPTPVPLPVYPIEEEGYPEIDFLIHDYYAAKINNDIGKLRSLSSNPSCFDLTYEQLQNNTEYDEDYRDIKCYIQKGFEVETYIVYVFYNIKISGINTLAPNLSKFYVVTNEEDNLRIFDGEMDPETKEYYDARYEDEDFKKILQMTNQKIEEARSMDEDLRDFWDKIKE